MRAVLGEAPSAHYHFEDARPVVGIAGKPGFADKVAIMARFARRFGDEDAALMRAMQKGLGSRYFERGPMHKLEAMIHHRINRYLDALEGAGEAR